MVLVKCLRMRIKVLFIASAVYLSSDITRLRLVVLLKIMVSPVLYQTIDTRQLLKTIPLFSKYFTITEGTVQRPPFNNTADLKL